MAKKESEQGYLEQKYCPSEGRSQWAVTKPNIHTNGYLRAKLRTQMKYKGHNH